MAKRGSSSTSRPKKKIEEVLVENFVSLQKILTNLTVKFEDLTEQISKLLKLFEVSARAIAQKDYSGEKDEKQMRDMLKKIDEIVDQNRTIARGLTFLYEDRGGPKDSLERESPPFPSEFSQKRKFLQSSSNLDGRIRERDSDNTPQNEKLKRRSEDNLGSRNREIHEYRSSPFQVKG